MTQKVAFVVDKIDMGGLQRVNSVIVNELSNKHKEVYLYSLQKFSPVFEIHKNVHVYYGEKNKLEHLFVFGLKGLRKSLKYAIKKNFFLSEKYQIMKLNEFLNENNIDTVILNSPAIMFASNLRENNPNLNIFLWIHNSADVYFNNYFKDSKKELIRNIQVADSIIALTRKDELQFLKFNPNVELIHNPVTIENNGEKSKLNNKIISVVGRLDIEHKGLDFLIPLSCKLKDGWIIEIIGDGNRGTKEKLKKMIKEANVEEKLVFRGSLHGKNLKEQYIHSSIYLMTSRWEGFPLVLAEAMTFGLPVIAFEQSGSAEVLNNGEYGILVENGNVKELVNQLNLLCTNRSLRKKYQDLSLERVKSFNLPTITEQWENIIYRKKNKS